MKIQRVVKMCAKGGGPLLHTIKSIISGERKAYLKNGYNKSCTVYQDIFIYFGSKIGEQSL